MHRYLKSPTEENRLSFMELGHQREPVAIRDLLEFVPGKALPVDEVETEASILSRFSTQAMSLGAISPETHRTLAIAMNRLGGRSKPVKAERIPRFIATAAKPTTGSSRLRQDDSASLRNIWFTPTNWKSRLRRARSPAKADSFRPAKCRSTSPACGMRCRR